MIPGLLAASGNDHSDTLYTMVKSDIWFILNGVPNGTSNVFSSTYIINPSNPGVGESDSRHFLFGAVVYDQTNTNQTVTGLKINGVSVDNFHANAVAFNTGTKSWSGCVGSALVPGNTSNNRVTWEITCSQTLPSGSYIGVLGAIFNCGTSGLTVTTGSDVTADANQKLDVGNVGNYTSALVMYGFEDTTDDSTSVTITKTSTRTISEQNESGITAGMLYGGAILNGDPDDDFEIAAEPNNDEASDEGILLYITAHY